MRRAWLVVVALACSKKSQPQPAAGSGSASGATAVAPAEAAPPADAAVDAALAAPPFKLATISGEKLIVVELGDAGVKRLYELATNDLVQFGWLDSSTLIRNDAYGPNDKPIVERIVDGKVTETAENDEAWQHAALFFTADNKEVWLRRCVQESEGPDECIKYAYRRVLPAPAKDGPKPANADFDRVSGGVQRRIPDVPMPEGFKLEKTKIKGDKAVTGIRCTSKAGSFTFPDPAERDDAFGDFTVTKFRFVLADPPIFEVHYDEENPVGQVEQAVVYFKACKSQPLGGFIGLGGARWGEFVDDGDRFGSGEWIFRDGPTKEVARLRGSTLRANQ